jgi:cyclase
MRKLAAGIWLETKYRGVNIGAIVEDGKLLLVDAPLNTEDGKSWLSELKDYGKPHYLALMDGHPDRVLGARELRVPIVAHDRTRVEMSEWSDSFKGSAHQIGGESDYLKRITGVQNAVPELTFSEEMVIQMGEREVVFVHRPGPTSGSIWILVPDERIAFVGDCVTVSEPPYIGMADVEAWLESMEELRHPPLDGYEIFGSRDGLLDRAGINAMARFLRKIDPALEEIGQARELDKAVERFVKRWIKTFDFPSSRTDKVALRLRAGLTDLYGQRHPLED